MQCHLWCPDGKGLNPSLDFCCEGPALTGIKEVAWKALITVGSFSFSRSNLILGWVGFLEFLRRVLKVIITMSWSLPTSAPRNVYIVNTLPSICEQLTIFYYQETNQTVCVKYAIISRLGFSRRYFQSFSGARKLCTILCN